MLTVPLGRPTFCVIDHEALRWNFRQIRQKVGPKIKILSMVKANAYGHGATAVAKTLAAEGGDVFGVATLEEALELRVAGIRQPIIVLAGAYIEQVDQFLENNLTPVVHEPETLRSLERAIQSQDTTLNIHLEVDTGMGRTGFLAAEVDLWLAELTKLKALRIDGVFSHFSDAESANEIYSENPLRDFLFVIKRLNSVGITPPLVHMAKSAAVLTVTDSHFAM